MTARIVYFRSNSLRVTVNQEIMKLFDECRNYSLMIAREILLNLHDIIETNFKHVTDGHSHNNDGFSPLVYSLVNVVARARLSLEE